MQKDNMDQIKQHALNKIVAQDTLLWDVAFLANVAVTGWTGYYFLQWGMWALVGGGMVLAPIFWAVAGGPLSGAVLVWGLTRKKAPLSEKEKKTLVFGTNMLLVAYVFVIIFATGLGHLLWALVALVLATLTHVGVWAFLKRQDVSSGPQGGSDVSGPQGGSDVAPPPEPLTRPLSTAQGWAQKKATLMDVARRWAGMFGWMG